MHAMPTVPMPTVLPFVDAPPPPLQAPPPVHPTKVTQSPLEAPLAVPAACHFRALSPDFTTRSAHASPLNLTACTVPFRCATTPVHGRHSGRGSGLSVDYSALVKTAVVDAMDSSLRSADEFDDEFEAGAEVDADLARDAAFSAQFSGTQHATAPPAQLMSPPPPTLSPGPCGTKLFVGQIPQRQDSQQWLERLFSPYDVQEVQVRTVPSLDKRGRAWKKPVAAFVWAGSPQMAEAAVAALHDHEYKNGRLWFRLSVELSRSLVPPSFPIATQGH